MSFETTIFINCPFDNDYKPLKDVMLFTVIYCGLSPIMCQTSDSGQTRVDEIKQMINVSKFCIHDLSRMEIIDDRFNMPFELGLDLGCKHFGNENHKTKKCLIFEKEKYRIKSVLSDLAGNDIYTHNNEPEELVSELRNWLKINLTGKVIFGGEKIWQEYNLFKTYFETAAKENGHSKKYMGKIPYTEFIEYINDWIKSK